MAERNTGPGHNPHAIVRITVEKLFGQFTYELPTKDDFSDISQLFILYGDNGSGKTTILNVLFHLLSSEDGKGNKSFVSRVPFKRFSVELANGTVIEARRSNRKKEGVYTATILKGTETLESVDLPLGPERDDSRPRLDNFLRILGELELGLHLLPDNRRIQRGFADESIFRAKHLLVHSREIVRFFEAGEPEESADVQELRRAVESAALSIRAQAFKGSNTGQKNVNSIYTDIAKHIADTPESVSNDIGDKVGELIVKLKELSGKSAAYAQLGLMSELPVARMVSSMAGSQSPESRRITYNVISPYVRSIEAQLKALESVHDLINTFLRNLNKFFAGSKTVSFDLRAGFTIMSSAEKQLDLDMLSSGEKQLLLLLCNTLAARDKASILIIDEPEISLNIKWQRRLIQALLDCIKGSKVQLIFATHSIELLAQHKSHVVRLDNLETPPASDDGEVNGDERRAEEAARVGGEVRD